MVFLARSSHCFLYGIVGDKVPLFEICLVCHMRTCLATKNESLTCHRLLSFLRIECIVHTYYVYTFFCVLSIYVFASPFFCNIFPLRLLSILVFYHLIQQYNKLPYMLSTVIISIIQQFMPFAWRGRPIEIDSPMNNLTKYNRERILHRNNFHFCSSIVYFHSHLMFFFFFSE